MSAASTTTMTAPERVRSSCAWVAARAQHCRLGEELDLERAAHELSELARSAGLAQPSAGGGSDVAPLSVAWDAEDWHYCEDAATRGPRTCQYVFVLECVSLGSAPTGNL